MSREALWIQIDTVRFDEDCRRLHRSTPCAGRSSSAHASAIIDRNAQHVRLAVDGNGQALITYEAHGQLMHVRAWGAINARQPTSAVAQVRFRKDYSGRSWTSFKNTCRAYDGPKLAFQVAACAAT